MQPFDVATATEDEKLEYVRKALNGGLTRADLWGMKGHLGTEYEINCNVTARDGEGIPLWQEVLARFLCEAIWKANELGLAGKAIRGITSTGSAETGNLSVGWNTEQSNATSVEPAADLCS